MAIACLGLVTFLPLRPDLSLPLFISRISVSTFLPAEGEYFRPEDFFEDDFLAEDFFADDFRVVDFLAVVLFLALPFFADELLFFLLLDFFFAAFFVAIHISSKNQMVGVFESVVWQVMDRPAFRFRNDKSDNTPQARQSYKRIGDQPTGNAGECASDSEFEQRGRDPGMKQ